jgi:two-component system CheB/CheR fusion protein
MKDDMAADEGERIRELAFDADPVAQLVIDRHRAVLFVNERCRTTFGVSPTDVGKLIEELELPYPRVELRWLLEEVFAVRRAIVLTSVDWAAPHGEMLGIEAELVPLIDTAGQAVGVRILFRDVTPSRRRQEELKRSNQELENAYEKLQAINSELQWTAEELATTNEGLQSINEELVTRNLDLQRTNEELRKANDELRHRGDDVAPA